MNLSSLQLSPVESPPAWKTIQSIIGVSLEASIFVDINFILRCFNKEYVDIYEKFDSKALVPEVPVSMLFPDNPDLRKKLIEHFQRSFAGETFSTTDFLTGHESLSSISYRLAPIKDEKGQIAGSICYMKIASLEQDGRKDGLDELSHKLIKHLKDSILALEEAENVLTISDKKFQSIYEYTPTGIGLFDRSGKILEANPAFEKILGYSVEELAQICLATLTRSKVEEFTEFNDLFLRKIESLQIEKKFYRPSGELVWGLLNISLIHHVDNEGKDFAIATIQDITNKKLLERQLKQRNEELKSSNDYLDNFVYAIAHDLRAPIANMKQISNLILMLDETEDPIYEKLKASVDRLDRTASGLIQILDTQKVEGQQINSISFEAKVNQIKEELEPRIKASNTCLKLDFTVKKVVYLEPYFDCILRNLVQNAIKYAHADREPVLNLKTWRDQEYIILSIEDNGIGIDLKKAGNRLFRPFKRFTNKGTGFGIGLHLIKSMVEKNGGKIEVQSKLGKGSTFNIFLKPYEYIN